MREQDRASGRAWIQVGSVPGRLEETSWSVHTCSTKARAPEDIWTPPKTSGNPSSSTISRLETTAASPWELQGRRADVWMLEASKMSGSELGQCCRTARPVPDLGQFPPPPADFSRARPAHRHRPGPRRARGCGTGPIPRAVLEKSPPQCQILDNSPRPPPILPAPAPRTATARGPAGPVGAVRARSHGPFSRNRRPSAQVLSAIVCPRRPCFSQACICCPALSFFNQCFFPVCFSPPLFLLFALFFFLSHIAHTPSSQSSVAIRYPAPAPPDCWATSGGHHIFFPYLFQPWSFLFTVIYPLQQFNTHKTEINCCTCKSHPNQKPTSALDSPPATPSTHLYGCGRAPRSRLSTVKCMHVGAESIGLSPSASLPKTPMWLAILTWHLAAHLIFLKGHIQK